MTQPSFVDRIKQIESGGRRFGSDGKILEGPQTRYGTAKGEMQVLDGTARDPGYGVAPAKDGSPEELARVGREYAGALLNHFGGDQVKAAAAYNYGPGNVQKLLAKHGDSWMGFLPSETKNYVAKLGGAVSQGGGGQLPEGATAASGPSEVVVAQGPSGPIPLPQEILAQLAPKPMGQIPVGDAWAAFLKSMPQGRRPVAPADLEFSSQRVASAPQMGVAPIGNRQPNFEAFSGWRGRAA